MFRETFFKILKEKLINFLSSLRRAIFKNIDSFTMIYRFNFFTIFFLQLFHLNHLYLKVIKAIFTTGAHYNNMQTRPNAIKIIAVKYTNICKNVLQRLVYSQERCMIFKDRKINCSCICIYCANMRLLLTVCHAIYYHCKIYRFQFPCFATNIYLVSLARWHFHFYWRLWFVLSWLALTMLW